MPIDLEKALGGSLDLAVLALPFDSDGLVTEDLYDEEFFVALPGQHVLTGKAELSVTDLDDQTLLLLAEGHCLRDQALEVCSRVSVREPQDFRATSLETVRQRIMRCIEIASNAYAGT